MTNNSSAKDDQICRVLQACQSNKKLSNSQIKDMFLIITNFVIDLTKHERDDNKKIVEKPKIQQQVLGQKKEQLSIIQLQQKSNKISLDLKQVQTIVKQLQSSMEKLYVKIQQNYKLLSSQIDEQNYQLQRKLYQKWTYLFKEFSRDVEAITPKRPSILNRKTRSNKKSVTNRSMNEQQEFEEKKPLGYRQMSVQFNDRYQSNFKGSSRVSNHSGKAKSLNSQKQSLQRVHSEMKKQKITLKNQLPKRQLVAVNENVLIEKYKKSCKIKIQSVKMWIAIGVIDFEMRFKPIKQIGQKWVYYCNDGEVWNGRRCLYGQGIGFRAGEIIQISFDLISKVIQWTVKGKIRHELKYQDLNEHQNWVPFVYFFNKGDSISIMSIQK